MSLHQRRWSPNTYNNFPSYVALPPVWVHLFRYVNFRRKEIFLVLNGILLCKGKTDLTYRPLLSVKQTMVPQSCVIYLVWVAWITNIIRASITVWLVSNLSALGSTKIEKIYCYWHVVKLLNPNQSSLRAAVTAIFPPTVTVLSCVITKKRVM